MRAQFETQFFKFHYSDYTRVHPYIAWINTHFILDSKRLFLSTFHKACIPQKRSSSFCQLADPLWSFTALIRPGKSLFQLLLAPWCVVENPWLWYDATQLNNSKPHFDFATSGFFTIVSKKESSIDGTKCLLSVSLV